MDKHVRELAVKGRNNLSDGLGGTGGGGDDVVADGTTATPVLVGGTIDGLLGSGGGVDGGHQTLNDTEVVVDDLGERSKAVGRARRVGDLRKLIRPMYNTDPHCKTYDGVLGIVLVEIHTDDEHGCIC